MSDRLPDLPGTVHGIVSLNPPTIQCDGCGTTHTHPHLGIAILTSGIIFDQRGRYPGRLCRACRTADGWADR